MKENRKKCFVPSPTLGICEVVDEKGERFFELTKNGGHYLMLPPKLVQEVVRLTFEEMKEKGERPLLLTTAPNERFPCLFNTNISIIKSEFQRVFEKEPTIFVEETRSGHIFKNDKGGEITKKDVVAKIHDATTYFGVLLTGNPTLNIDPHNSPGARLFHVVNNVLAPKEKEAKWFGEKEGLIEIVQLNKVDRKTLMEMVFELSKKTQEVEPGLKLLVAKILSEEAIHAGGKYVVFCPFTSDEKRTNKRVRAFAKVLEKYRRMGQQGKVAFHKFLMPMRISIDQCTYVSHARYVDGNTVFFKLVPTQPISSKADIMTIKHALNTGRKGGALVVQHKPGRGKKAHLINKTGGLIGVPETSSIKIQFGGERESSIHDLFDVLGRIIESLSDVRKEILDSVFKKERLDEEKRGDLLGDDAPDDLLTILINFSNKWQIVVKRFNFQPN